MPKTTALALSFAVIAAPLAAADYSDPTWPCVQRKVETLSMGLMWALPYDPEATVTDAALGDAIDELASYLALRRVPLTELEPRLAAFVEAHGGESQTLGHVFATVFERLTKRRARIIDGIADFSLGQIALSEEIDANRASMETALAAAEPDFDAIDALEERLDWDQLIYTDRQRNIQYLCETPTLLERRLFSIAQMLQFASTD